ncbi:hypothetical protein AB0I28_35660 [Phytomonospora sp. NPDC050363]|uniref:hypothetical protein n=1 Tax=Phytomonospora sp. NPDC050363 TaxID=3155642 RepID=UPI0033DE2CE0
MCTAIAVPWRSTSWLATTTAALWALAAAGLVALRRLEIRLPPRRQWLSPALGGIASALMAPSALCAPSPFHDAPWAAGRMYDLELGLLLNLGALLWITTAVTVAVWSRRTAGTPAP